MAQGAWLNGDCLIQSIGDFRVLNSIKLIEWPGALVAVIIRRASEQHGWSGREKRMKNNEKITIGG